MKTLTGKQIRAMLRQAMDLGRKRSPNDETLNILCEQLYNQLIT